MKTRHRNIALGAVALTAALLAAGFWAFDRWQREEIFVPSTRFKGTPAERKLGYEDVWIDSAAAGGVAGGRVHGWWLPAATAEAPALLYLHGNADTISTNLEAISRLHEAGFAVLAIDYRGFGRSDAALPDERSAYADAQAAWARLAQLAPKAGKRLIYGHSLGGAIGVDLATQAKALDGLVVEGSFDSLQAVIETTEFGWLPLSVLLTQRFESDRKVAGLAVPKLFIHCAGDEVIEPRFGQHLYERAAPPKQQLLVPGGSHNACPKAGGAGWTDALRRIGGLAPATT